MPIVEVVYNIIYANIVLKSPILLCIHTEVGLWFHTVIICKTGSVLLKTGNVQL